MKPMLALDVLLGAVLLALGSCQSTGREPIDPLLLAALQPQPAPDQSWHQGPEVVLEKGAGPARFAEKLYKAFDCERAFEFVRFVEGYYRAPGNEGYELVLARLEQELRAAGFGTRSGLELELLESEMAAPAWTPRSAKLALLEPGQEPVVLHAFDQPGGRDRTMLPIQAPACDIEGGVAFTLDELDSGEILVTEVPLSQVLKRAAARHAAGVLSASLESFNIDPFGQDRHLEAIQFRSVPAGTQMPVAQISPRALSQIRAAAARAGASMRLRFEARVEFQARKLRTLCATVVGSDHPEEAVALVSHVQEPGACDNASGVAGLLESARGYAQLLEKGKLERPRRSVVFLWGDEMRQSSMWLDATKLKPIAGFSSDMTGESHKLTGARMLLERNPDPGALVPLLPDEHTPWGAGEVSADELSPNGLALIARCALVDVGLLESNGWSTADHPWEGGSDHDVFIEHGVPAVLFWHFTDFTYHTSLDRLEFVDSSEMRRAAAALLASALAVADPRPTDLERYLQSLRIEERVRVAAAQEAGKPELMQAWADWCLGARHWLRVQCLHLEGEEALAPKR